MATSTPPPVVDPALPNAARMYDYMLFGRDNLEVDRAAVRRVLDVDRTAVWVVRENRAYLGRAVRYLTETCGLRQFIDHGSGLPTMENVHQVVHRYAPDARVVYVDHDPVVLAHGRALLAENDRTTVVAADLANPEGVVGDPAVRRLIDFDQPVGLLYFEVLDHLLDEADPWGVVRRMLAAVPSGSYLALSAPVAATPEHGDAITRVARRYLGDSWGRTRITPEVDRFFDGLEVVPPGLGNVADWRLDLGPAVMPRPPMVGHGAWGPEWSDDVLAPDAPRVLWEHGGVARKP